MPIFNGTSGNDTLTGGSGNDSLTGLAGDDVLDGGAGVDTMVGGIGDDIYYVDNANDVIVENSGEGNSDLVISLLPSTYLPGNVEDGVIAISTPATITGNFLDNTLYAGDGDNTFSGGDGRDEVSYYFSSIGVKVSLTATSSASINGNAAYLLLDIEDLSGSNFNDSLTGDSSDNNLYGGGGNDSLIGQAGSDYLNGGTDADFMAGGIGEDGYVVDNAGDVVAENPGEGEADFVYSSLVSYTLPDNVEAGVVIVSTPASLIGNSLNNLLYSGSGDNTLDGGAGTDFAGYAFAPAGVNVSLDIVGSQAINGSGSDTLLNIEGLSGSDFDDVLTGNSSDNSLYGGWGNDSLIGGAGHDYLSGGTGDDRLDGGADSDTASYTNANSAVRVDLSLESAQNTVGAGTDTLISIENLVGSAFNDALSGDSGANIVSGQDGNDTVIGGLGNDTLSGGIGFDIFQFDTAPNSSTNLDIIIDFNTGIDKIALAHSVFTALPAPSIVSLQTGNFVSGAGVTSANDANDFIIYDSTTGALYYDADGSGGSAPIQVATLLGAPALIAADITFSDNASLVGDDGDNFLSGGAGNDTLDGGAGNDTLDGWVGNDSLVGGLGNDVASYSGAAGAVTVSLALQGSAQNTVNAGVDILFGMENLSGGSSNDSLTGDDGANILFGADGNDTLSGGGGNDTLEGGAGDNMFDGGDGRDAAVFWNSTISVNVDLSVTIPQYSSIGYNSFINIEDLQGSKFGDSLTGDARDNSIFGLAGNDYLTGKAGDDWLVGGLGDDAMDGGAGIDTASYDVDSTSGVTVTLVLTRLKTGGNLPDNRQNTGGAGVDNLFDIENLVGSSFSDKLTGNSGDNKLTGGQGNDTLEGGLGSDTAIFFGNSADFTISHIDSGFTVVDNNTADGNEGTDTIANMEFLQFRDKTIDVITLGAVLNGSSFNDTLIGGVGDDTLNGGIGNDFLDGVAGIDTATYFDPSTFLLHVEVSLTITDPQNTGDFGVDTLLNIENLIGSRGSDKLTGNDGPNRIEGKGGLDTIDGGLGNDTMIGGPHSDIFVVRDNGDVVVELWNNGQDRVDSYIANYTLPDNVEDGRILATGSANITGNEFVNSIDAGIGDNVIDGKGGAWDIVNYEFGVSGALGVTVSLALTTPQVTGGSGTDTLLDIEWLYGSNNNDNITGNDANNVIKGNAGADMISGGVGIDELWGGAGNDTIFGGLDVDHLYGEEGNDEIHGDAGDDILVGGPGNDSLYGGAGDDSFDIDNGSNFIDGGDGLDFASTSAPIDRFTLFRDENGVITLTDTVSHNVDTLINVEELGFDGVFVPLVPGIVDNVYYGSIFDDTIVGSDGDDVLSAFEGNDNLQGGDGNDSIVGGAGNDLISGGNGIDTAIYAGEIGVTVSLLLQGAPQNTVGSGIDTLLSIENLRGSLFNDLLIGDASANRLTGFAGNDTLQGGDGDDTLNGGLSEIDSSGHLTGSDLLDGGDGNDWVDYDQISWGVTVSLSVQGVAQNTVGAGMHTLMNIENAAGSFYHDALTGNALSNMLVGAGGNDTLSGLAGDDKLTGGFGNDALDGGADIDTAVYADTAAGYRLSYNISSGDITVLDTNTGNGDEGQDVLTSIEVLHFGDKDLDLIQFSATVYLAKYDDLANVFGSDLAGATRHYVEWGFQEGRFTSTSSGNNETLTGTSGDDTLTGGTGNDTLNGGTGIDTAVYADTAAGYRLSYNISNGDITVLDTNTGNGDEGQDVLTSIEVLHFGDKDLDLIQFSATVYLAKYDDLANVFGSDLAGATRHYVEWGFQEGRFTSTSSGNNETLTGTSGDDTLSGGAGNDTLNGGTGIDTAVYADTAAGYRLSYNISNGDITVLDTNTGNGDEGQDVLSSIEVLHFADKNLDLTQFNATAYLAKYDDLANVFGSDLAGATRHYVEWGFQEGRFTSTSSGNNETLTGTSGDDTLAGGTGNDTLNGGTGIDTAVYADTAAGYRLGYNTSNGDITVLDTNTGNGDEGQDVLSNIEVLHFTDKNLDLKQFNATAYLAKYDDLANVFGSDLAGATRHYVEWGFQEGRFISTSSGNNETLTGTSGDDTLTGGAGNDTLNGGTGIDTAVYADTAAGYRLSYNTSNGDITVFDTNTGNGDEGQDVLSNIEVLHFTDKNLDLTQFNVAAYLAKYDDLANVFGSDLAGATRHYVEWGFQEGRFTSTSSGNNETLTGTSGDDTLSGGAGNDTLNGGTGIDTAVYADTAAGYRLGYNTSNGDITVLDTNTGNGDEGQDVLSNIEVLHFTDKNLDLTQFNAAAYLAKYDDLANVFGSDLAGATRHYVEWGFQEGRTAGNGGNDVFNGTAGVDFLYGGTGNDTLDGLGGNDVLTGGIGIDRFVFSTALSSNNIDTVMDFVSGTDKIVLDNDIFIALTSAGALAAGILVAGPGATPVDGDDHLLYDSTTGLLYYDVDGIGGAAMQQILTLVGAPALTTADLIVS